MRKIQLTLIALFSITTIVNGQTAPTENQSEKLKRVFLQDWNVQLTAGKTTTPAFERKAEHSTFFYSESGGTGLSISFKAQKPIVKDALLFGIDFNYVGQENTLGYTTLPPGPDNPCPELYNGIITIYNTRLLVGIGLAANLKLGDRHSFQPSIGVKDIANINKKKDYLEYTLVCDDPWSATGKTEHTHRMAKSHMSNGGDVNFLYKLGFDYSYSFTQRSQLILSSSYHAPFRNKEHYRRYLGLELGVGIVSRPKIG